MISQSLTTASYSEFLKLTVQITLHSKVIWKETIHVMSLTFSSTSAVQGGKGGTFKLQFIFMPSLTDLALSFSLLHYTIKFPLLCAQNTFRIKEVLPVLNRSLLIPGRFAPFPQNKLVSSLLKARNFSNK